MEVGLLWRCLMLILVHCHVNGCFGCWEQERIALLQLKESINGPYGTSLPSWDDKEEKESNCCNWEMVECNITTGRVIGLYLNNTRDWDLGEWYLNASLFLPFEEMRYLDLSDNSIVGWVPNEGLEKTNALGKLEVLILSENYFNNSFLPSPGMFASLKRLYLRYNHLRASNNTQGYERLSKLINLEVLDLGGHELHNIILSSFRGLSSLKFLNLAHTIWKEPIQIQNLPNFKNLEALHMDDSTLNDSFLQTIGMMTSLKVLSLPGCGLNGSLTAKGLCELLHLQELDINNNNLEGILPWCLANLTSLQLLDLSGNQFRGNISLSPLSSLTFIKYLSLSDNHFQIPISLGPFLNHSKLKYFNGQNNEIYGETDTQSLNPKFQLNAILLSGLGHSGAFPKFLYHQYDLQVVDLSHHILRGEFLNWLIENNTKLETLFLVNNSLSGPFHLPIHPHMHLIALDISNNYFQGHIPTEAGSYFPKLELLNMSGNSFDGSIPSSLGNMNALSILDLSNNHLSGGIPEHLAMGCFSLILLDLSNNNLQGQILTTNLTNLLWLQLDGNHFTGGIPDSLSNSSLLVLDISDNHISGTIPAWMGNTIFGFIIMPNNHLEGPIPIDFCGLFLFVLDLSENNISGSLPSCFSPSFIDHLHLSKNRLQGPLTTEFYNSSYLVTLDLSHNHLTGSIPDWISRLSWLSYLLLNNNNLEDKIPIQLCQLDRLSLINLSHNNLFGPIPHCLNITTLEEVSGQYIASNRYKYFIDPYMPSSPSLSDRYIWEEDQQSTGFEVSMYLFNLVEFTTKSISYVYQGSILTYMSGIDLSCNNLTGEIPYEIGKLNNIHSLNLSHNNLKGPIPAAFSNLRQMESLDLSYNNLDGKIPPQLTELTFLVVFKVAHNNLSGKTPEWIAQFATFDGSSYEGNPFLCGPPLPRDCATSGSPSPTPNTLAEKNGGFIDMYVFRISFVVSYITVLLGIAAVLFINPHWRQAWFYFIEVCITTCYYFVVDTISKLSNFRIM